MATVQDYLNMAVSMTVGNKSGTDNQFRLPNDFRKFEDLKVKTFEVTSGTAGFGDGGVDATAPNILQVSNSMESPYFTAASGGSTAVVSWFRVSVELEA